MAATTWNSKTDWPNKAGEHEAEKALVKTTRDYKKRGYTLADYFVGSSILTGVVSGHATFVQRDKMNRQTYIVSLTWNPTLSLWASDDLIGLTDEALAVVNSLKG